MAQRIQADFDNYRKRTQKENAEFKQFATADIITDILTIIDDFDRAIASAKEDSEFVSGVKGIRYNLMKTVESRGVKEIPAEGKFDPNFHEAFAVAEGEEDDMIAEVFQKGYTLNGKVLRYAKVKVTKKKEEEPETPNEESGEEKEDQQEE